MNALTGGAVTLLCPVRGCREPLVSQGRQVACARRHAFDVARSGYVNLLQPRDRRSARPGDAAAVRDARGRFQARGFESPLAHEWIAMLSRGATRAALDVGCGDGHHLAALVAGLECAGYGVDISVDAIDAAARRFPALHWVVANADRVLPYGDASFDVVTSITARRNATEFRRVLRDDGALLVVVPGPDDLIELRHAVLGEGVERDRVGAAVAAFAPLFALERHERLRHVAHLGAADVADAMTSTYRGLRAGQRERLAALGDMDVTLSRDALLLRPAAPASPEGPAG